MCGRFTLTTPTHEDLTVALGLNLPAEFGEVYRPRYNIAPTDAHWVVRMRDGVRELMQANWGLTPLWAKRVDQIGRPINARAETLATKPAFRDALTRRRCIVVADGFYEWETVEGKRLPIWFRPQRGGLLLMAGIYERWIEPTTGVKLHSFAIVTTPPNDLLSPIHDRMPAILPRESVQVWLACSDGNEAAALELLRPAREGMLRATPVSSRVNSVRVDDESCVGPREALDTPQAQTLSLFGEEPSPRRKRQASRS